MCPELSADVIPLIGPDGNMRTLAEIESAAIDYALNMCGSRQNAAIALGIGRSTLYRRIRELGGS
jgi:transcriptional regulator of acetoin/glycerol metabolism